jgi:hypothetical protein
MSLKDCPRKLTQPYLLQMALVEAIPVLKEVLVELILQ